ncbi:ABC transporter ATP-binding protein [Asticcacaulis excentricus]|uniref:ABC transporter related protein n=1 Tax=Asticcacaulis excentricus (strain ATCC 15261 / DSM 4724 / KCTC 12464 / NCIMB 9791 / VKM B-1370 / CB 48) TaxID=573065 RepID=E8RSZ0_ASTEC|nr:ABC transporter ATP-binding protein [Asticcacaulis excentricus]ADU14611.1 ABC transporter related protein [Asticcacaulis excentricus CB 48]
MIETQSLSVRLAQTEAVSDVSVRFEPGRIYGLVGPNGSGKTTLLRALAGLVAPSEGVVRIDDHALSSLSLSERAARIGYLPQTRSISWDLTVREIVQLGAQRFRDAEVRAEAALTEVGLSAVAHRRVFSLSGGQAARVLLARLLATDCQVLLLDEPLTALDPAWQRQGLGVLKAAAARGHVVIASLHDLGLAAAFCDSVCVMHDGRMAGSGAPEQAFTPALLAEVFHLNGGFRASDDGPALHLAAHPVSSPTSLSDHYS